MSTTFTRVAKVLVTNTTAANTGTSVTTVVDGDVILFDRSFTQVGDTDTVQTNQNADVLYVGLGVSAGALDTSMPIQVRNIRSVKRTAQTAATQMSVTVGGITAVNNTEYIIEVRYRDMYATTPGHSMPRAYSFTSDASATALEIATGLAAKINADKNADVTAAVSGSDLVITGKPILRNAIDTYQRVVFDVAYPYGFTETTTLTYAGGADGQGVGARVKDMEQATKYDQRILFPIPSETTRAQVGTNYNLVTIEHYHEHIGDLQNQRKEPLKTVIAFASGSGTASAKEAAFMVKLSSVVESAGIFVS
jgi:hypothetical protein